MLTGNFPTMCSESTIWEVHPYNGLCIYCRVVYLPTLYGARQLQCRSPISCCIASSLSYGARQLQCHSPISCCIASSLMSCWPQVVCKFWEKNMCTKGPGCTFAHGSDDLKRFAGSGPAYRGLPLHPLPASSLPPPPFPWPLMLQCNAVSLPFRLVDMCGTASHHSALR